MVLHHILHSSYVSSWTQISMRWIGRGGLFEWPPCSPYLLSLDFFLWGYFENVVFTQRPTTREDLIERILKAWATISRETAEKCGRFWKTSTFMSSSRWRALRIATPWLTVTLVAMLRGNGTHVNQPPETWEARGTHGKKAPQRKQNLLRPRRRFWVTLKVRTKCLYFVTSHREETLSRLSLL